MKSCELCKYPARAYCESDQASLCWDCDAMVHGANFLVARHSRTLLCDACQSPTPWKAAGAELGNTVSVCRNCDGAMNFSGEDGEESDGDNESNVHAEDNHDEDDAMLGENDGCAEGGDEDGYNQVVMSQFPWSSSTPPPPASSSSSDESVSGPNNCNRDISESSTATSLKRRRHQDASDRNFQDGPSPRYIG